MPPQIDPQQLIDMLMQLLTQAPNQPVGDLAGGTVPQGPPAGADTPDPMMAQLYQLLQGLQAQNAASQGPQQAMNASSGVQGGMYGAQGGRPPGS